jgi:hypothetical protein
MKVHMVVFNSITESVQLNLVLLLLLCSWKCRAPVLMSFLRYCCHSLAGCNVLCVWFCRFVRFRSVVARCDRRRVVDVAARVDRV